MRINFKGKYIHPDAIFLDLDGTLLDDKKNLISNENLEAIKKEQMTSKVFIATGRKYGKIVKEVMQLINIDYAICQNGALIIDKTGKKILEILIEHSDAAEIIKFAKRHNLVVIINSEKKLYSKRFALKLAKIFSPKKFFSFKDLNIENKEIHKIVLAGSLKDKMYGLYSILKKEFPSLSYCLSGDDYVIEITSLHATKGIAANFLCDVLALDNNKSVHIGDSLNDASTLNFLYTMIAMGNSSEHLKEIVKNIGPDYKKGGVAKILQNDYDNF
ncbi:MAG: Cof-type HAD-IIB family hydrolase [Metamycoplasmataceae bacterium]